MKTLTARWKSNFTKKKSHENACQKMHPDRLEMYQKAFGGWALPGPAGELKRSLRPSICNEVGQRGEEEEEEDAGGKGGK